MGLSINSIWLLGIGGLWSLWFIILCCERKWFRDVWAAWKGLGWGKGTVMAVLCAVCTVSAQKPRILDGGDTNSPPDVVQSGDDGNAEQSFLDDWFVQQQIPSTMIVELPENVWEAQEASSEPSRIVFQTTPAGDPRTEAVFSEEPGWGMPVWVPVTPRLNALSFAGNATNTPSPIRFGNTDAVTVQTLMFATRGDSADLATLLDAPETARLRLISDGSHQTEPSSVEQSLTRQFIPQQWQLVAVDFETPAHLSGMVFGGTAGRPVWNRGWRGEIAEIVGFDMPPDADIRAGVANYLAIRWGLGPNPASPGQRQAAINAGLDYGLVWGSVFFLK